MIRLNINSKKHGLVYRDFETQEQVDKYIAEIGEHWGRKEDQTVVIQYEVQDEQGNIIEPLITEVLKKEVDFEQIDMTKEIEAEKTKKEKKKKYREDRVLNLKKIVWKDVKTIAELKDIVKALVDETLKDDE